MLAGGGLIVRGPGAAARAAMRAKKQFVREQQSWVGYVNQTRFSRRWGSWDDLHMRQHDHFVIC